MEFEKDPSITNQQRILAATKSVTINPLNASIIRDEAPEPLTVIERQPNIEQDSENTAAKDTLIQPSDSEALRPRNHHFIPITVVSVIVVSLIGLASFIALTTQ